MPKWLVGTPGVKIFDNVTDEERDRLLGASWCCLATSVREGWGLMVTESAAAGTPTVAYDVPGLRDSVVDGITGILVTESQEAAAKAIEELLRSTKILYGMATAARLVAQDLTWVIAEDAFRTAVSKLRVDRPGIRMLSRRVQT